MKIIAGASLPTAVLIAVTSFARAEGCTPNHELYRIVPEHRASMLDAGNIKRVMFVDTRDERLTSWKPGHNLTYCADENKIINTTINSVVTLVSQFVSTCKTLSISDTMDRSLNRAWDYANTPNGDPSVFVAAAKSDLGWYYKVCTDHTGGWFEDQDFKNFLGVASSLTRVNMAIDDPANENTYKARAAKYEEWRAALYAAEENKGAVRRLWERLNSSK